MQSAILALPPLLPQIRAGKVRALAVTTSKRSPTLPDVPTITEAGFPQARATKEYLDAQGADVLASPPDQFAAFLHKEFAKWEKVIRETRIRAD